MNLGRFEDERELRKCEPDPCSMREAISNRGGEKGHSECLTSSRLKLIRGRLFSQRQHKKWEA